MGRKQSVKKSILMQKRCHESNAVASNVVAARTLCLSVLELCWIAASTHMACAAGGRTAPKPGFRV
jgi:hypothetical protein